MTGTRRDSGRKGGLTTLRRHGKDKMREWGKLGGRPRALTYDDIRQQQLCEQQNNDKEGKGTPGNSLNELKRLHKLRQGSTATPQRPPNKRYKVAANNRGRDLSRNPTRQVPAGKDSG